MKTTKKILSSKHLANLDNKQWKKIADIALYAIPLYNGVVMGMPLDDTVKLWIITGLNTLVVGFKGISKFTSHEEDITDNNSTTTDI